MMGPFIKNKMVNKNIVKKISHTRCIIIASNAKLLVSINTMDKLYKEKSFRELRNYVFNKCYVNYNNMHVSYTVNEITDMMNEFNRFVLTNTIKNIKNIRNFKVELVKECLRIKRELLIHYYYNFLIKK